MAVVAGQVAVVTAEGLTVTIDSDDTTGAISAINVVNASGRPVAFWWTRNGTTAVRTIAAGTNLTFNPPSAGVKWLTDAISWGIG